VITTLRAFINEMVRIKSIRGMIANINKLIIYNELRLPSKIQFAGVAKDKKYNLNSNTDRA